MIALLGAMSADAQAPDTDWAAIVAEKDRQIAALESELAVLRAALDERDEPATPEPTAAPTTAPTPTPAPVAVPETFAQMQVGSRGDDVKAVQDRLTQLLYAVGVVDGIYGNATGAAVEAFQTEADLPVTGTVDEATYMRLFAADAPKLANLADDQYAVLAYREIMNAPDTYIGRKMRFAGRIAQVLEQDGYALYRIATKGDFGNIVYAVTELDDTAQHYTVEQQVDVFATCAGVQTYETVLGGTATIPSFLIDRMREVVSEKEASE